MKTTIVTVHGTFARNWLHRLLRGRSAWWYGESAFGQTIREGVPECSIVPFAWSGRNTHRARAEAGGQLAVFLTKLRDATPGQRICVIGHSHGGNVALRAINRAALGVVSHLFLLGTPQMCVDFAVPSPCDVELEGAQSPCHGGTRHWLFWGDAASRVGQGIWCYYSEHDLVQVFLAGLFTGLPRALRGRCAVLRTFDCRNDPRVTNVLVDMDSRSRYGWLARKLRWDGMREHNALPSRPVAEMIAAVLERR